MRELSLFTGAGGGVLGTKLLGWETLGYVEWENYCQKIIQQRIKDGIYDKAPIFGDIRTFVSEGYARRYRGMVDVVTGGFPCQPFSVAGKQQADDDERNMWPATIDVIREVRPKYVFLENVSGLLAGSHGYFGHILGELAQSGYDVRWRVLSAAEVGAPHKRDRLWVVGVNTHSIYDSAIKESISGEAPFTTRFCRGQANRWGADEKMGYTTKQRGGRLSIRSRGQEKKATHTIGSSEEVGYTTSEGLERYDKIRQGDWFEGRQQTVYSGFQGLQKKKNLADTRCEHGSERNTARMEDTEGKRSSCDLHNKSGRPGCGWWGIDPAELPDTECIRQQKQRQPGTSIDKEADRVGEIDRAFDDSFWPVESFVGRVANGVADRTHRLKAIGNGQVPAVVAAAWFLLTNDMDID